MNIYSRIVCAVIAALALLTLSLVSAQAQVAPAATTTVVTATPNPSFSGTTITVTATVTSAQPGTITGNVRFFDNINTPARIVPVNAGVATFTVNTLPAGNYSFEGTYLGNASFATSVGRVDNVFVNQRPTTTVVTATPNPSIAGQTITVTATVTSPQSGTITGNVRFFDNINTPPRDVPVNAGVATFTVSNLPAGTYAFEGTYQGDFAFGTSVGRVDNVVVNNPAVATTTTVTLSPNPSTFNQQVTITATVTSATGGTPTGEVYFTNNQGGDYGPQPLVNGVATFTSALVDGMQIIGQYLGDSNFATSTGTSVAAVVTPEPTTTTVTSAPNPSVLGQAVTLTATVIGANGNGGPQGTIEFFQNGVLIGDASVTVPAFGSGIATLQTSDLSLGNSNITAVFTPQTTDPNLLGSTSAVHVHVANATTNNDSARLDDLQNAATGVAAQTASESITDSVGQEIRAAIAGQVQVMSASDGKIGLVYAPGIQDGAVITPTADIASGENNFAAWRIWSSLRYTHFGSTPLNGDQVNFLLGSTFLLGDGMVAGLVAGYENQDYKDATAATLRGKGFNVGGYVGGALDGGLNFDAQVHASFLNYDLAAGGVTGSTSGTRIIAGGGLSHTLQFGDLTIEPTARFSATWENQAAYSDSAAVAHAARTFNFGRLSGGAKIAHRFDAGDGASFTPFVTGFADYRFSGGLTGGPALMDGLSARVGAGFDYRAANGITAGLLGEIYGLGLGNSASAQSVKLQVAIPF